MNNVTKKLYGSVILAATCLLFETAFAQQVLNGSVRDVDEIKQPAPVQEPKIQAKDAAQEILVVSESTVNEPSAGKYLRHYENADAALSRKITRELQGHGLISRPTRTNDDLTTRDRYLLTYRIESLEFGFKTPFGRHTRMKVSYGFKRPGGAVVSGEFEENSKKGWKNCVITISEKIAGDVSNALAGKFNSATHQKKRQATAQHKDDKTMEERLQKLDDLKAKGLVTHEEYNKKREEILGDL